MSHDPRRRDLKRLKVSKQALEASQESIDPIYRRRLYDALGLVKQLHDDLRRDVGDSPTARERRDGTH